MASILAVALGGSLGAVARYGIANWLMTDSTQPHLPWGTITANLLGCFLIGLVYGLSPSKDGFQETTRPFVVVGLLGGFTTYSAFGLETVNLFRDGATVLALANVALQLAGGIAGVVMGLAAGTTLGRP